MVLITAHVFESKPMAGVVVTDRSIVERTISGNVTYVLVVISPATQASPVVTRVSQATRAWGSSVSIASRWRPRSRPRPCQDDLR